LLLVHVKVKAHGHKTPNFHGYAFPRANRARYTWKYDFNMMIIGPKYAISKSDP
jgi:hypothetical protein